MICQNVPVKMFGQQSNKYLSRCPVNQQINDLSKCPVN